MRSVNCRIYKTLIKSTGLAAALTMLITAGASSSVPDEFFYFSLLKEKYTSDAESYGQALIDEFAVFRNLYPLSQKSDSVEFMLADLYEKNKNEAAALANYLKIVYVYPSSPLIPPCLLNLQRLSGETKGKITSLFSDDKLKALKGFVLKILEDELTSSGGQQGYLEFIRVLADAAVSDLTAYTITECQHYLYRLNYEEQADRVMVIRGDMFCLREEWRRAILAYRTVPLIEPYGEAVAESILKTGDVHFRRLENYSMAAFIYKSIIETYPEKIEAAQASMYLAEIERAKKNYAQAVLQLEDTAKRFPFPEIRMECYTRIAWLYLERLNDVGKAILFYERHISEYPGDLRSAALLVKIGELHEKQTRNYSDAVGAYRRLAELFPADPQSPEYLLRAAGLADTKLNDPILAASLYEQLTKDYPQSNQGKTAAEILRKRSEN